MTSIITRQREFAVLQSIGMTGRQLKTMLTLEGLFYTLSALLLTLFLSLIFGPLLGLAMNHLFWFFTFRFTILPVIVMFPIFLIIGIAVPRVTYRAASRQSIVDRIREND